jgi:aminocarboxymuconate-semialdehyde decarboxylase
MAVCSLMFGGVLEKHPKLKVCLAHGGGSFPYTMGRIEHGYNVRILIQIMLSPRFAQIYVRQDAVNRHCKYALNLMLGHF